MGITSDTLERLARFDTPTICNVIELFALRPRTAGYMDHRVRCCFPELPPLVGYAATASFRSSAPPAGRDAYGSIQDQLEQFQQLPGPAAVVFQDLDDPPVGAVFGEVMCSSYQAFGSAGLVTNGAGRDLAQVHALGFPVFTGSTICSHADCHILHIGLPVHVGGLVVRTGDLLHGDANGVTNIPLEIATDVAGVAPEFVAAEQQIIDYAKSGGAKSVARYRELRAAFQASVSALSRRITARGR